MIAAVNVAVEDAVKVFRQLPENAQLVVARAIFDLASFDEGDLRA